MNKLVIMCGVPAAGKSTYIKLFKKDVDMVVSMDDIRKELCGTRKDQSRNKEVYEIAMKELRIYSCYDNCTIWYDATNIDSARRKALVNEMRKLYDDIICIYLDTPDPYTQNRGRNEEERVPDEVITNMLKRFKKPTLEEGFDRVYTINNIHTSI